MKPFSVSAIALSTFAFFATCTRSDSAAETALVSDHNLIVSHVFAPAPVSSDVMSLYFTIENTGQKDDTLLTVRTTIAEHASVHESVTENGITRMQPLASLPLPAGQTVELAPGGVHVMLSDLTQSISEGDTVYADLVFASAPSIALRIPVVSYADAAIR